MTYREQRKLKQKALTASEKIVKAKQLRAEAMTISDIAKELKCSIRTVNYCLKSETLVSKQEALVIERAHKDSCIIHSAILCSVQ